MTPTNSDDAESNAPREAGYFLELEAESRAPLNSAIADHEEAQNNGDADAIRQTVVALTDAARANLEKVAGILPDLRSEKDDREGHHRPEFDQAIADLENWERAEKRLLGPSVQVRNPPNSEMLGGRVVSVLQPPLDGRLR